MAAKLRSKPKSKSSRKPPIRKPRRKPILPPPLPAPPLRTSGVMASEAATPSLTRNQVIQELSKSSHGNLKSYLPVGLKSAYTDSEFYAHLIAWNEQVGQVRDSKVALPVIHLHAGVTEPDFVQNALAHMALRSPRELAQAVAFGREIGLRSRCDKAVKSVVTRYLRIREAAWPWWERTVLSQRAAMKALYVMAHVRPVAMAESILFRNQYPPHTVFETVRQLKTMSPVEAAGHILERKIPFLVAQGAMGEKMRDESVVLALIERMSPAELVTNMGMLEKLGVKERPSLRAALDQALTRAAESKKAKSTFKTSRAAAAIQDEGLSRKLSTLQERQIDKLGGVEGNWAVLGDKSGSMTQAISVAKMVAATLSRMVRGKVWLVFFDSSPRGIDVTGKTYEEILALTKHIDASGGTNMGSALELLRERSIEVDGIAVVSDSAENAYPPFAAVYTRYCDQFAKTPPVYLYKTLGEMTDAMEVNMHHAGHDLQVFDLRQQQVDYYSLPNLVQTMRTQRYSLADQILESKLLTLDEVLKRREVA